MSKKADEMWIGCPIENNETAIDRGSRIRPIKILMVGAAVYQATLHKMFLPLGFLQEMGCHYAGHAAVNNCNFLLMPVVLLSVFLVSLRRKRVDPTFLKPREKSIGSCLVSFKFEISLVFNLEHGDARDLEEEKRDGQWTDYSVKTGRGCTPYKENTAPQGCFTKIVGMAAVAP